eukprot:Anaeramoba_ignava/c19719_g1_i2.p1 GENE.c19719_g1_i2~~c19719_g1_i2.p1  ORF type:complete len:910 (+),score=333.80 c19719_g1_i2:713-3442(+)
MSTQQKEQMRKAAKQEEVKPAHPAKFFIKKIKDSTKLSIFENLSVGLKTYSITWIKEFISENGPQAILQRIITIGSKNIPILKELIESVKGLMSNPQGIKVCLEVENVVDIFSSMLIFKDIQIKKRARQILAIISVYHSEEDLNQKVFKSVTEIAKSLNLTISEFFEQQLTSKDEDSESLYSCVSLLNCLIFNGDLEEQNSNRLHFNIQKIGKILSNFKDLTEKLQKQMNFFFNNTASIESQMQEIYGISTLDVTDLETIINHFEELLKNMEYDPILRFFRRMISITYLRKTHPHDIWNKMVELTSYFSANINEEKKMEDLIFFGDNLLRIRKGIRKEIEESFNEDKKKELEKQLRIEIESESKSIEEKKTITDSNENNENIENNENDEKQEVKSGLAAQLSKMKKGLKGADEETESKPIGQGAPPPPNKGAPPPPNKGAPPPPNATFGKPKVEEGPKKVSNPPKAPMTKLFWEKQSFDNIQNSLWKDIDDDPKFLNEDEFLSWFGKNVRPDQPPPPPEPTDEIEQIYLYPRDKSALFSITTKTIENIQKFHEYLKEMNLEEVEKKGIDNVYSIIQNSTYREKILFYKDDTKLLEPISLFFYQLFSFPFFCERINFLKFQQEFSSKIEDLENSISLVSSTCKTILNSSSLKKFLQIILTLGNYMNGGSNHGGAFGFSIKILGTISDIKSTTQPEMNFIHYLVHIVKESNPEILDIVSEFSFLPLVLAVNSGDLNSSVNEIQTKITEIEQFISVVEIEDETDHIITKLNDFVQQAKEKFNPIQEKFKLMKSDYLNVLEYFSEKRTTTFETLFSFINNFIKKINESIVYFEKIEKEKQAKKNLAEKRRKMKEKLEEKLPEEPINFETLQEQIDSGHLFQIKESSRNRKKFNDTNNLNYQEQKFNYFLDKLK